MAFWGLVGVISFPSNMMVPASLVDARQTLDEGGFSRAVFAQQGVDLAGPQEEIHAVQRLHAGELDLYAPHFEYVFRQSNSSFALYKVWSVEL